MSSAPLAPVVDFREAPPRAKRSLSEVPWPPGLTVRDVLRGNRISTYFQPILSARQRTILGVEALARVPLPDGSVIGAPWLFRQAAAEGVLADLEQGCCENAIERFARLPHRRDDQILFVNLGAWATMADLGVVDELASRVRTAGVSPAQVAIEILEDKVDDLDYLRELVERFRHKGFLMVLDDVGSGHSNLDRVPLLKPDILKIDRRLVTQIDTDFHKQETLKSLVGLSRRIGALVVAEGLETEAEAIVALELGADLLQGHLLGRADSRATILRDGSAHAPMGIKALAQAFKTSMVRKINHRKLQHRRFNILLNEVLCHLANVEVDQFDDILQAALVNYPSVECVYVLDGAGIQVTDTVWNPNLHRRTEGSIFRPAPRGTDHSLKEYYYILLDVELQKYTTDPYVSFASGNISRTISTYFRDARNNTLYVLCIDVLAREA